MTRPVPLSRRHFVKQAAAGGAALTPGNATRAFLEYAPMRFHSDEESERVFRHVPYERDLDIFVIDMRSSRAENSANGNGPVLGREFEISLKDIQGTVVFRQAIAAKGR